jgi:hypothetical protein
MLPPVFVELKANVSEFTAAMGEARTEMSATEAHGSTSLDKLAGFGKAALFGLGTAAVGVGVMGVEMADKFEISHAKLETALKNAGTNFEEYSTQIGKAQKTMEGYGYTNAQTQEALANLTTALKDPKKALDDLGIAADLAKYKHIDLADAATAVAKAQEGNLKALKQMGIDLPIAAGGALKLQQAHDALGKATDAASAYLKAHSDAVDASSKNHATYEGLLNKVSDAQAKVNSVSDAGKEIMKGLSDAIGGQAATQAATFSGKMEALKAQTENVVTSIGMKLIPILEKLVGAIKDVIDWFNQHKTVAEAMAYVIGTVIVTAIGTYLYTLAKAATESVISFVKLVAGWTGIGTAATVAGEEAVVAGDEITVATGGINIAIGVVVAAILYLATHWKEVWNGIKDVIKVAWDWIKEKVDWLWNLFTEFSPLGIAIKWLADHWSAIWNGIKDVVSGAWDWIKEKVDWLWHLFTEASPLGIAIKWLSDHWSAIWGGIKDVVSGAWNFVENIIGKIGDGIRGFVGLVKSEINGIISLVNTVIRVIDSIHVKIPDWVPLIGGKEFGLDIPQIPMLANGGIVTSPTLAMIGEAGAEAVIPLSKMGGMGGGINVVVNVQGSVIQEKDLAVTVRDGIAQLMRRRGLNPSILGV